ncbi:hypothetical protein Tco_1366138 [Tanacetum coccineum]
MKTWVEIIHENMFCLGSNRDHVLACLCHVLYCIATSKKYNLAFFVAKRMKLLTRLFNHVMSNHPELSNGQYVLYDRLMLPLAPHYERKTRKDYGTKRGRLSTSASSAFDYPSSSYHIDDDNDETDEGTPRTSTPSPTRYVNSMSNEIL